MLLFQVFNNLEASMKKESLFNYLETLKIDYF